MAKRFTDTDKYKKPFIRSLKGAYKLLWDYIYHDCNHAGIWIVDFDIANIYLGKDINVNMEDALKYFNKGEQRIIELEKGEKWFVPSFIEFQYGELNDKNRAHNSVLSILKKYNITIEKKPLISPLEGAKDKDKDKDKDKVILKNKKGITKNLFETFWKIYPKKTSKGAAKNSWDKICNRKTIERPEWNVLRKALRDQKATEQWSESEFIPNPSTWLNQERWLDDPKMMIRYDRTPKEKPSIRTKNKGESAIEYKQGIPFEEAFPND